MPARVTAGLVTHSSKWAINIGFEVTGKSASATLAPGKSAYNFW
jgi:hypothetical protein